MTDSVQNLLLSLRLKSENTEDAPEPPILRVRVPGVDSAASGDGACRIERISRREKSTPSRTSDMIRSNQWIGGLGGDQVTCRSSRSRSGSARMMEGLRKGVILPAAVPRRRSRTETGESVETGSRTPAAPGVLGVLRLSALASRSPPTHEGSAAAEGVPRFLFYFIFFGS